MNIGINAMVLMKEKTGGMETYLVNLLKSLNKIDNENKYYIFDPNNYVKTKLNWKENYNFISFKVNNIFKRLFIEQIFLPYYYHKLELDVILYPGNIGPTFNYGNSVVTLHDLLYKQHPQNISFLRKSYYKWFLPRGLSNANKIITISNFAKNEAIKFLEIPEKKMTTVYHGINFQNKKIFDYDYNHFLWQKENDYLLYVGTIAPRKNIKNLIKSYNKLVKKNNIKEKLVLVGKNNIEYNIKSLIQKLKLEDHVIITGYVSNEELYVYYQNADLFIFPSLYEGFGLPLLEAMYHSIPVISSNSSCLPEIAKDAAVYFDPNNIDDMSKKILKVIDNNQLQKKLIAKGKERIKKFNWEKTAKQTLNILESSVK